MVNIVLWAVKTPPQAVYPMLPEINGTALHIMEHLKLQNEWWDTFASEPMFIFSPMLSFSR